MSRFLTVARNFNWLLVLLVAPLLLVPNPAKPWVLALVPLILILHALLWRSILPSIPLNPALLLLSLAMLASLYATTDLAGSFPKIAGLLLGLLVFFTATRYAQTSRGWQGALWVFCLLGLSIAGIGLLGTNWVLDKIAGLNRITALLPFHLAGLAGASGGFQPNEVAGVLLWVLPVLIGAALAELTGASIKTHPIRRWAAVIALTLAALFTLGVLLLTQSRSAYLGLAIAVIVAAALALPSRLRRLVWILAIIISIALVAYVSITGWQNLSKLAFTAAAPTSNSADPLGTLTLREQIWSRAIRGLQDFGLLGMGLNRFRTVFHQLYPSYLIASNRDIAHAHNELLQAGVELGYLGLIAFLSLNLTTAAMLWHTLRQADRMAPGGRSLRWLALGLGAGWLAHSIYGLTDAIALGARPGFMFWYLLALIAALYHLSTAQPPIDAGPT